MKINFLLPHLKISGGIRISLNYADSLAARGYDVCVYVPENSPRRYFKNLIKLRPDWFPDFRGKIKRISRVNEGSLRDADVLIADSWKMADLAKALSLTKGKKFQFIQHDERLYHGDPKSVEQVYHLPFKKIVVSTWLKNILKDDFGADASLLINSIDKKTFYFKKVEKNKNKTRILMLYHSYEWKGSREGVEIIQELKARYPQVEMVLYGARRKELDFEAEYHFNPPQEKLAEIFSSAEILLCPSWDEGFGLPSVEAMNCKCALVTYNNGGSRDFAFDMETAMVAERRNKEELKNKLEKLIVDESLRRKIAGNGFEFVQKMPSLEEQTGLLEKILKS